MKINEFLKLHFEKAKLLSVFDILDSDSRVKKEDIESIEEDIGCRLPLNYIDFCLSLGGGYFGFTIIHSMDDNGKWYIGDIVKKFNYYLDNDYIPFSDDQTGGFYCFKVDQGVALNKVYYIDSDGSISETEYEDFFDYVIDKAYSY